MVRIGASNSNPANGRCVSCPMIPTIYRGWNVHTKKI